MAKQRCTAVLLALHAALGAARGRLARGKQAGRQAGRPKSTSATRRANAGRTASSARAVPSTAGELAAGSPTLDTDGSPALLLDVTQVRAVFSLYSSSLLETGCV